MIVPVFVIDQIIISDRSWKQKRINLIKKNWRKPWSRYTYIIMYIITMLYLLLYEFIISYSSYNSPKNNKPILVKRSNSVSSRGGASSEPEHEPDLHSPRKMSDDIGSDQGCRPRHRHIGRLTVFNPAFVTRKLGLCNRSASSAVS